MPHFSAVTVEGPPPSAGAHPRASDAPALTADDLRRLTGGRLLRESRRPIRGAAVDSRLVGEGQLFVALPGDRTDGHRFLAEATVAGAAALLVSRPVPEAVLDALGDVTVLSVPDGLVALGAIAAGWRARFDPLVVGVTGSIAKTSTKEAVAAVLGAAFRTLRSEGNQNNEIGLPLTLLRLGPDHGAAVLEMGMYAGGEIADLARMARPEIGVVTCGPRRPPQPDGLAGGHRAGQGRADRGPALGRRRGPQPGRPARSPDGRADRGPGAELRPQPRCGRRGGRHHLGRASTA